MLEETVFPPGVVMLIRQEQFIGANQGLTGSAVGNGCSKVKTPCSFNLAFRLILLGATGDESSNVSKLMSWNFFDEKIPFHNDILAETSPLESFSPKKYSTRMARSFNSSS
ncbi:MAG: hypothetical protein RRY34_05340, partial [Victivallaceae bacterium]